MLSSRGADDSTVLRLEDALETFFNRLPLWRAGQREAGRTLPSESPERKGAVAERSPSRRAPSPSPVKKKEKSKGKDKDRDRDRDRDKDRSRDRDRRRKAVSRSVSISSVKKKKKKDKDRKRSRSGRPAKNASRSRSVIKPRKSEKLAEPPTIGIPASTTGFSSSVAKVPAASAAAASMISSQRGTQPLGVVAQPGVAAANVPDWLTDLVNNGQSASRKEIMVPQQQVSRLIGKGGETIMNICRSTGADVRVNQGNKEMGYSLAVITGHPNNVEAAEMQVRQKLGLSVSGTVSKEIPILPEHATAVVNSLVRIRQAAGGCSIDLKNVPGTGFRAIVGPGTREQIMLVEQLLTAALAESIAKGIKV